MTTIQIQVFAALKDYFDTTFELNIPSASIDSLRKELEKKNPDAKKLLQACRFAVNDNFVSPEYHLNENDKVAILPPSSGG